MPAPAVIPAPMAYIIAVAVKKLVVELTQICFFLFQLEIEFKTFADFLV